MRTDEQRREVLLVEDDQRLAGALSLALGDAGHSVRGCPAVDVSRLRPGGPGPSWN